MPLVSYGTFEKTFSRIRLLYVQPDDIFDLATIEFEIRLAELSIVCRAIDQTFGVDVGKLVVT